MVPEEESMDTVFSLLEKHPELLDLLKPSSPPPADF